LRSRMAKRGRSRSPRARAVHAAVMDDFVLDARVEHIRNFLNVLSVVKLSKKQHVNVSVSERGVTFVAVDDSKSLQAQANFRAEVFSRFRVNASAAGGTQGPGGTGATSFAGSFGIALGSLIDVLSVFAPMDGEAELSLRWPDRDGRLVLAAHVERGNPERPLQSCTHAAVAATERDDGGGPGGGDIVFRGETNAFTLPAHGLKEIVDDLEWPNAPMAIEMSSDPNVLTFSAAGQEIGELRVDVDARDGRGLTEFACGVNGRWLYRHAFAKAATALPGALLGPTHDRGGGDGVDAPTMTRVAIGEGGMLKVVHLVRLSRAIPHFGGGGGGGGFGGTATGGGPGSRGTHTQSATPRAPASYVVPVTFVAYPEVEMSDGEYDDFGDEVDSES